MNKITHGVVPIPADSLHAELPFALFITAIHKSGYASERISGLKVYPK